MRQACQHGHCLVAAVAISIDVSLLHKDANLDAAAIQTTPASTAAREQPESGF